MATQLVEIVWEAPRPQVDRWRRAAERAGLSLEEWRDETLDRASAAYEADQAPYGRCETCNAQLPPPKLTGRPRRFCPGKRGNNYCRKGRRLTEGQHRATQITALSTKRSPGSCRLRRSPSASESGGSLTGKHVVRHLLEL